jgi:hypothetical protein
LWCQEKKQVFFRWFYKRLILKALSLLKRKKDVNAGMDPGGKSSVREQASG